MKIVVLLTGQIGKWEKVPSEFLSNDQRKLASGKKNRETKRDWKVGYGFCSVVPYNKNQIPFVQAG